MLQAPISEALAKLQNPSQNDLSGKPLGVLETLFELSRSYTQGFREFLEELLRSSFGNPKTIQTTPTLPCALDWHR